MRKTALALLVCWSAGSVQADELSDKKVSSLTDGIASTIQAKDYVAMRECSWNNGTTHVLYVDAKRGIFCERLQYGRVVGVWTVIGAERLRSSGFVVVQRQQGYAWNLLMLKEALPDPIENITQLETSPARVTREELRTAIQAAAERVKTKADAEAVERLKGSKAEKPKRFWQNWKMPGW